MTDAPQDPITSTNGSQPVSEPLAASDPYSVPSDDPHSIEMLTRRLPIVQRLASHQGDEAIGALADLIAERTGRVVPHSTARGLWADLLNAGWMDPAQHIEPIAEGIFPSIEIEVIRARCLNCGDPFNGIAQVDGADINQDVPGRTSTILHIRLLHDCRAAREQYRHERGKGTA